MHSTIYGISWKDEGRKSSVGLSLVRFKVLARSNRANRTRERENARCSGVLGRGAAAGGGVGAANWFMSPEVMDMPAGRKNPHRKSVRPFRPFITYHEVRSNIYNTICNCLKRDENYSW